MLSSLEVIMGTDECGRSGHSVDRAGTPFPSFDPLHAIMWVRSDSVAVLSIWGELDIATAPPFCELVNAVIADNGPYVVLDLFGISFCDMSGLRALQCCGENAYASGGVLVLTGLSDRILWLLKISGFERVFAPVVSALNRSDLLLGPSTDFERLRSCLASSALCSLSSGVTFRRSCRSDQSPN
jgi:anti-sigma B factor antagonist